MTETFFDLFDFTCFMAWTFLIFLTLVFSRKKILRYKFGANRRKRSASSITTTGSSSVRLLDLEDRRSKLYLAMNTKLELNENGHPICPEVPKKPHAHPYLKVLRYLQRPESRELSELYNLNGFAFGLYNRLPHPSNCG